MPQRPPFSAIYSQALYSPDYGFPLFRPNPLVIRNLGTGLSTRDEVQIGTVGYITREGFFRTIGNVSSIINLEETGLDVQDTPEFFIQPSVDKPAIYNTTGHRRSFNMTLCTGENIAFTALGFGAGFQVDLASASVKGGFLALPEGAYLQKLDNEVMLEEAFYSDDGRAQLLSWLEALEARVGEGPISIITEHIKCKSWGTAAVYDERHSFSGQLIFQAMGAEASVGGSFAPYMWHCSQSSSMVANANRSSEDREDQCVYLRGFRIAKQRPRGVFSQFGRFKSRVIPGVDIGRIDNLTTSLTPAARDPSRITGGTGSTSSSGSHGRVVVSGPMENIIETQVVEADEDLVPPPQAMDVSSDDTHAQLAISPFPDAGYHQLPHPLDVVNEYILSKHPEAQLAVTHDSILSVLLSRKAKLAPERDLVASSTLDDIWAFEKRDLDLNFDVTVRSGVASLVARSHDSLRVDSEATESSVDLPPGSRTELDSTGGSKQKRKRSITPRKPDIEGSIASDKLAMKMEEDSSDAGVLLQQMNEEHPKKRVKQESDAIAEGFKVKKEEDRDDAFLISVSTWDRKEGKLKKEDKEESGEDPMMDVELEDEDLTSGMEVDADDIDAWMRWTTLAHAGVLFPPPYEPLPSAVKMLYNGQPVDLPPESEEVAGFYAALIYSDVVQDHIFPTNFFEDWLGVLQKYPPRDDTKIDNFDLCDFRPMFEHFESEKAAKKAMSADEKKEMKTAKEYLEAPYAICILDGMKEKVGNFRVEPPGLFRGRGNHPKKGKLKLRVRPEDITINIGEDSPIPVPNIPGQWKKVIHDHTVTWLASWVENINGHNKYVFLAPGSSLKGQSDMNKFEKARELKSHIDTIRKGYEADLDSKVTADRMRATAMYFIDKLSFRAGNEKGEDEADTVGCCSLRCQHLTLETPNIILFDFLGQDSIRYFNRVQVSSQIYGNIRIFKENKVDEDLLFDHITTSGLNRYLGTYMAGLTVKVFRTYNSSIIFQGLLSERNLDGRSVEEKVNTYNAANRDIAILFNHRRSVPGQADSHEVALGTSKMNYLDPRITVAWCKASDVPLEKIFSKSLIDKFSWAMSVDEEWQF